MTTKEEVLDHIHASDPLMELISPSTTVVVTRGVIAVSHVCIAKPAAPAKPLTLDRYGRHSQPRAYCRACDILYVDASNTDQKDFSR